MTATPTPSTFTHRLKNIFYPKYDYDDHIVVVKWSQHCIAAQEVRGSNLVQNQKNLYCSIQIHTSNPSLDSSIGSISTGALHTHISYHNNSSPKILTKKLLKYNYFLKVVLNMVVRSKFLTRLVTDRAYFVQRSN